MLDAMCTASMPGRKAYSGEEWHTAVILAAEKQKLQEALLSGAQGTWSLAAVTLRVKLPIHSPLDIPPSLCLSLMSPQGC